MTSRTLFLGLAAAGLAATANAQVAPPSNLPTPRPVIDLTEPGAFVDRAYPSANPRDETSPHTAIDHRFAADAVVGQLGYLCGIEAYAASSQQQGGGPLSGFGRRGTFLGASLDYAFR